ncbi:MAG: ammonia-dependent NAD(+) synthetase [Actinomycetes bacterium]
MNDRGLQQRIIDELEVVQDFDAASETERRVEFLADYVRHTGSRGLVLGISGGVDSTVAGRLCQLACERVRAAGGDATFVAMRLPYGVQNDEHDARSALEAIAPDEVYTVNVKVAVDSIWDACLEAGMPIGDARDDYVKGNVKARARMIAQYTVAGARHLLVVGTDQAAEALVGFYTKFGDGAADLIPLFGLPKRRVRDIGHALGLPMDLLEKVPTADLEDDKPLIPDEVALGVRYSAVDDYLEGGRVSAEDEATMLSWYHRTAHKRALPVTPAGWEASRG